MTDERNDQFWSNAKLILFAIFSLAALVLFYHSISVLLVSLIGIGMGVIVSPLLSLAKRRFKIPRALGALLCLLFITAVIGVAGYGIWFLVSDQVESLSRRFPEIQQNLESRLSEYPGLQNQLGNLNLGATARNFASTFFKGIVTSITAISGFVFALILSLYTTVALDEYFAAVVRAFPEAHRDKARHILSRCATTLRLWFRAQLIDMVILGIITAIGLWMVGIDYWAVYGLLTAIFSIIPYIGLVIVIACASLITLASEPSQLLWVLAVFMITQQIEGNFVLPMVMKGQVELPEVPLLIFMLLLGSLLGIVGVLLAPPLFALLRVLYVELYLPRVGEEIGQPES